MKSSDRWHQRLIDIDAVNRSRRRSKRRKKLAGSAKRTVNPRLAAAAVGVCSAGAALMLSGCATPPSAPTAAAKTSKASKANPASNWRIEPVLDVQHAMASADAYYAMGRYYEGMRDDARAIDAYRKALHASPEHAESWNALGVALARRGDPSGAIDALRHAVAAAPDRSHLHSNLGHALVLADSNEEGAAELKRALRLDPNNAVAFRNLRQALFREDHERYAEQDVQRLRADTTVALAPAARSFADLAAAPGAAQPAGYVSVPLPVTRALLPTPKALQVIDVPTTAALVMVAPAAVADSTPRPSAPLAPVPRDANVATIVPVRYTVTDPERADGIAGARIELTNGNGIRGAATRLRTWLSGHGVFAFRLSNQPPYQQQRTVIQYRPGMESAARRVERELPAAASPKLEQVTGLVGDVRVLIGHDWAPAADCTGPNACKAPVIAHRDS